MNEVDVTAQATICGPVRLTNTEGRRLMSEHSSKQYDQELESIRSRILEMGGLVESQLKLAIEAFDHSDLTRADEAIASDRRVNALQIELDRAVNNVIARRQPTASDLRLIMGVSKAIIDLERIGDESAKIARVVHWVRQKDGQVPRLPDFDACAVIVGVMLRGALDAFARLDGPAAVNIIRDDQGVDERFRAVLRHLIRMMTEDAGVISTGIDVIWAAKAIERIGDHAKNIAEHVIYIAQGEDIRHTTIEVAEQAARGH
jgi:phosphate transport system protein